MISAAPETRFPDCQSLQQQLGRVRTGGEGPTPSAESGTVETVHQAPSSRLCLRCGASHPSSARFCHDCGASLEAGDSD
ncbi:MAG: zinc-ribbon domain-containing protein [Planctomycetota bacterium]